MLYPLLPLGPSLLPSPTQSRQRSPCRRPCRDLQMDPDPLRLLETAHPLRSPTLRPSPPNSRFRLRPSYRLTRPKTVNKRVNKIEKFVDGPTQMSRRRRSRSRLIFTRGKRLGWLPRSFPSMALQLAEIAPIKNRERERRR